MNTSGEQNTPTETLEPVEEMVEKMGEEKLTEEVAKKNKSVLPLMFVLPFILTLLYLSTASVTFSDYVWRGSLFVTGVTAIGGILYYINQK